MCVWFWKKLHGQLGHGSSGPDDLETRISNAYTGFLDPKMSLKEGCFLFFVFACCSLLLLSVHPPEN
jgi:hypothetical protein